MNLKELFSLNKTCSSVKHNNLHLKEEKVVIKSKERIKINQEEFSKQAELRYKQILVEKIKKVKDLDN